MKHKSPARSLFKKEPSRSDEVAMSSYIKTHQLLFESSACSQPWSGKPQREVCLRREWSRSDKMEVPCDIKIRQFLFPPPCTHAECEYNTCTQPWNTKPRREDCKKRKSVAKHRNGGAWLRQNAPLHWIQHMFPTMKHKAPTRSLFKKESSWSDEIEMKRYIKVHQFLFGYNTSFQPWSANPQRGVC